MTKIIAIIIWGFTLFGLNGTFTLVQKEFATGNICPKIIGIPACYIILVCFLLVLLSHAKILNTTFYFIGAGIAWLIAFSGTLGQIMGWLQCPKTAGGTPMCYISLAFFSSLLVLKFIHIKALKK